MMKKEMKRRAFIGSTSKAAVGMFATPLLYNPRLFGGETANSKLDIACIGLGDQMQNLIKQLITFEQNLVAICDVDTNQIAKTRKKFEPAVAKAKVYKDYRELLEREKSVDAVVIATPDHWHAALSKAAIQAGKHVYCEKPLTHTVGEARQLAALAKQSKVVTQTGNMGSASSNFRRSIELIQAGVLGSVREVHIWHPARGWPAGMDTPTDADPIPAGFDWNFWIGPAPMRPYKKRIYHPMAWRSWYDFGGGLLADFCCHAFSMPVRALDLDYPNRIEVSGTPLGKDSLPKSCKVHFSFPARGSRGPVSIHFYTGREMTDSEATAGMAETFGRVPETGCLLRSEKGVLSAGLWNNECFLKMKGEPEFRHADNHDATKGVAQSLPRAPQDQHMLEWIEACRGKGRTFSPFEIGGHVTEIGAAGLVALRLGRNIEWDGPAMVAKGLPETAVWVKPQRREEWGL
jgi:predicted dehydrogenase